MDLAARRFAEQGYHGTSVGEIVQGLGVGKGVFYWYFSSKEELFEEILREAQNDLREAQRDAIRPESDAFARIEAGIRSSMRWLAEHKHLFSLIQQAATESRFQEVLRESHARSVSDLSRHVRDGIEQGVIRDEDPEVLTNAVLGVIHALNRTFLLQGTDAEQLLDVTIGFCLAGLRAQGATAVPAGPAATSRATG
jgi:AcrR family transcriptional regulator